MSILTSKTNVALVDIYALNTFSRQLSDWAKSNANISSKVWQWKVTDISFGSGDVHRTFPMIALKFGYWGNILANFNLRLRVNFNTFVLVFIGVLQDNK